MNEVSDKLKKIGMSFFIEYFHLLIDETYSTPAIIDTVLIKHPEYSIKAIRTRISKSRYLLKNNLIKDALTSIYNADKIDIEIKDKAKYYLNKLKGS